MLSKTLESKCALAKQFVNFVVTPKDYSPLFIFLTETLFGVETLWKCD